ncbi:MAG: EndoU domain-containing protein [Micavibrio aeruginosavorus]|uniref:EndoU domain-containing protein n=1 Tax=Micavibrio aeruginosavorus TaxID=349221 RepID=A0A7T5R482_9BACT|nr:MAG: EndoU domain-containing protein [Micavibrio aeruginosavorus]
MKPRRLIPFALATAATLWLIAGALMPPASSLPPRPETAPVLTAQGRQHLLYGDERGGGHLHGAGRPCKSEFPASWDAAAVIDRVQNIAANDNINWRQQDNGYHVAEQTIDDIRVRVILNQDQSRIITAYPTNVPRNPCPAKPANDP